VDFAYEAFARSLLVLLVLVLVPGLLARADFDSSATVFVLAKLLACVNCIGHGSSDNGFLADH